MMPFIASDRDGVFGWLWRLPMFPTITVGSAGRGGLTVNSVYFPRRVIPMLPEKLSMDCAPPTLRWNVFAWSATWRSPRPA